MAQTCTIAIDAAVSDSASWFLVIGFPGSLLRPWMMIPRTPTLTCHFSDFILATVGHYGCHGVSGYAQLWLFLVLE